MTTNELSTHMITRFYQTFKLFEEIKALFAEKENPSSSKEGKKSTVEVASSSKISKSLSP